MVTVSDTDADSEPVSSKDVSFRSTSRRRFPLFDETHQRIISDPAQYAEIRGEIDRRVERLRRQLKKIGNVGTESLDNLIELETRFQRLHTQLTDLEAARDALSDIVRTNQCRKPSDVSGIV